MTWLWWAPLGATTLHIVEEFVFPGGFADWDRRYRPTIRESITPRLHILVNAALVLACVQLGLLARASGSAERTLAVAAWLAIAALLFSNAIFHVVGTARTRERSPGVITGVALYMPLAIAGYWHFVHRGDVSWWIAATAALVGGSYHAWAALLHRARAGRGRPRS